MGSHIYMREGQPGPESPDGFRLLAHEVVHTLQQSREGRPRTDVSRGPDEERGEGPESEAHRLAEAAAFDVFGGWGGVQAEQSTAAPAITAHPVSPQCWPWDEPTGSKPGSAPSLWDTVTSAGSSALGALNTGYRGAAAVRDAVVPDIAPLNKFLGQRVDSDQELVKWAADSAVSASAGIPVVGDVVQANAMLANGAAQVLGGASKGVGDIATSAIHGIFHPLEAVKGMLDMAEHTPGAGGTLLKAQRGLYDIVTGNEKGEYGSSLGELGANLLDRNKQNERDLRYWSGVGGGTKAWEEKPLEAAARTVTNLAPLFFGMRGLGRGAGRGPVRGPVPEAPVPESPVSPKAYEVPRPPGFAEVPTVPGGQLPVVEPISPMAHSVPRPYGFAEAPTVLQGPRYAQVRYGVEVGPNGELIPRTEPIPPTLETGPPTSPGLGPEAPITTRDIAPATERSTPTLRGLGEEGPPIPENGGPATQLSLEWLGRRGR